MKFLSLQDEKDLSNVKALNEKRSLDLKKLVEAELPFLEKMINILNKDVKNLSFQEKLDKMQLLPFYSENLAKLNEKRTFLTESLKELKKNLEDIKIAKDNPKIPAPRPAVAAAAPAKVPAGAKLPAAPVAREVPVFKLPAAPAIPVARPIPIAPVAPALKVPAPAVRPVPPAPAKRSVPAAPARAVPPQLPATMLRREAREAEYKSMIETVERLYSRGQLHRIARRNILDVILFIREFDINESLHAQKIKRYYDHYKNGDRDYGLYCPTNPNPGANDSGAWLDLNYTPFHAEKYNPFCGKEVVPLEQGMRTIVTEFHLHYDTAKSKGKSAEFLTHSTWADIGCIEAKIRSIYKDFILDLEETNLHGFIQKYMDRYNEKYGIDGDNAEHLAYFELLLGAECYRDYLLAHGNVKLIDGSKAGDHAEEIYKFIVDLGFDKYEDIIFKYIKRYCSKYCGIDLKTKEDIHSKKVTNTIDINTMDDYIFQKISFACGGNHILALHANNLRECLVKFGFQRVRHAVQPAPRPAVQAAPPAAAPRIDPFNYLFGGLNLEPYFIDLRAPRGLFEGLRIDHDFPLDRPKKDRNKQNRHKRH